MDNDDRAVSVTVGYVLNVAVAALLISGLLIAGSGLIESQTEQVTTDELEVIGQQLADELSGADRLVRSGDASTLSVRSELPQRTAAGGYTIEIQTDGNEGTIELRTSSPDVTVTVPFQISSDVDVREDRLSGGAVRIEYDTTNDRLEVIRA